MHRCEACASCWCTHIFSDWDNQRWVGKQSIDSETTLTYSDSYQWCWLVQMSLLEVLFQRWLIEHSLPCYLYRFGITANLGEGCESVLSLSLSLSLSLYFSKLFHSRNWQSWSVPLDSWFHPAETKLLWLCWPCLTCHAWFSFATWFVGFDVLHNKSAVRSTISPTAIKTSQVTRHQINIVHLHFIASTEAVAAIPTIPLNSPHIVVCHMLCQFSTLPVYFYLSPFTTIKI